MSYDPYQNAQTGRFFQSSPMHEDAMRGFFTWLQKTNPAAYNAVREQRPDLMQGARVIIAGDLSPANVIKTTGMSGLGDVTDDSSADTTTDAPATNWGQETLDFLKQAVPSIYQFKAQQSLIDINIKRAEQGLPPIDASVVSPQVNVGVSKDITTLGYVAIGGFVLFGLMSMFKGRRA